MRNRSRLTTVAVAASWIALACRPGGPAPEDEDTADPPARVCDEVEAGTWTVVGPPFGMQMDVTVAFDEATCEFTTTNYTFNGAPMSHPSEMWGGVVDDGDQVFAYGSTPFWDSCTGTLLDEGTRIEGSCADAQEGSDWFELTFKE